MPTKKASYQELEHELQQLTDRLESGALDIDAAVSEYAKALLIIKQLEQRLTTAKNKITDLASLQEK